MATLQDEHARDSYNAYNAYLSTPNPWIAPSVAPSPSPSVAPIPSSIHMDSVCAERDALRTQLAAMVSLQQAHQASAPTSVASTVARPTPGPSQKRRGTGTWRQWNKWCWSCGINLGHNTPDCSGRYKKSTHEEHLTATHSDPQGGNMKAKREHLWMKWCHPEDCRVCDSPS